MILRHETRRPDYYVASRWLPGAVFLVVAGGLAYGVLRATLVARDEAERLAVELTIRNMRTGMQLAMGEAIMQQREAEVAGWTGVNPVRWLGTLPANYVGACAVGESGVGRGVWCFDAAERVITYTPVRRGRISRHDGTSSSPAACERLAWQVIRPATGRWASETASNGLRIEPAGTCRWSVQEN